jgi:predicted phage-related endonuclease
MARKIRELKQLEALIQEAEEEAETIRDSIKADMTEKNADSLSVDVYKVRWQTITGSRFDSTAFKNEAPELYNRYTIPTVTRRFTVV